MSRHREVMQMPKETKERRQEQTLREPAPDEQGHPTNEGGGPVPLKPKREQRSRKEVLREQR